jgi:lysophospholipase L1-like esterase
MLVQFFLSFIFLIAAVFQSANNVAQPALNPALPTLFIAGDSTAARNNGVPIQGWGEPFAGYFDPAKINIANRAIGGRSSRTFITDGRWDHLLAEVKEGDFVLIQFGHNDGGAINEEPPGSKLPLRARGTLPGLGEESQAIDNVITKKPEVVYPFGWYIRKMIADTQAKGATPILLSLTPRNIWRDGKVERGSGRYRAWIQELALIAGIEFIDVTRIVADRYQAFGQQKTAELFGGDYAHTNTSGADLNAASVVAGLKGIRRGPQFGKFLSEKGRAVEADVLGWLNLREPANPSLPTLFLIGDSTVRNGRGDGAGGQWGWGDRLGPFFNPAKINIVNRAVGGLSSRTFLTQAYWERVLGLLKPGDFVIMQFGHNDSGLLNDISRARGTIQGTGDETQEIDNALTKQRETVHSFGWYLRKYIRDTKAQGATPIVCSPIPRKIWKDGRIVRSTDSHAGWARTAAAAESVGFVDLNELIAAHYDELGLEAVNALFADEHTHTTLAGAELNAKIAASALGMLPENPLGRLLTTGVASEK